MASRQTLEQALQNPNVSKFLDLLSYTEGTTGNGYHTAFGGGRLSNLSDHPRYLKSFKQTNGKTNKTSAAGRYQFIRPTWDALAKQYGFKDFGAHNQDLGAVALLAQNGALPYILKGDFGTAVSKAGGTWASLPSSPHPQPTKSWRKVNNFLGGKINIDDLSRQSSRADVPIQTVSSEQPKTVEPKAPDYTVIDEGLYKTDNTKADSSVSTPIKTQAEPQIEDPFNNSALFGTSTSDIAKPDMIDSKVTIQKQDWNQIAYRVFGTKTDVQHQSFDFTKPITRAIGGVIKGIV